MDSNLSGNDDLTAVDGVDKTTKAVKAGARDRKSVV